MCSLIHRLPTRNGRASVLVRRCEKTRINVLLGLSRIVIYCVSNKGFKLSKMSFYSRDMSEETNMNHYSAIASSLVRALSVNLPQC